MKLKDELITSLTRVYEWGVKDAMDYLYELQDGCSKKAVKNKSQAGCIELEFVNIQTIIKRIYQQLWDPECEKYYHISPEAADKHFQEDFTESWKEWMELELYD